MTKKIVAVLSLMIIVSSTMNNANAADTLDYRNRSVTDDRVASPTHNMSVTSLITDIGRRDLAAIRIIDLSNNSISSEGAIQFLRFIWERRDNLTALQTINLSKNQISIFKGSEDFDDFVDILISVLEMPTIQELILTTNQITRFQAFADIKSFISGKVNNTDRFLALTSKIIK